MARPHVPEIIQRDLEGRGDNIAVVQLQPDAAIADIAQGAREYAAPLAGEQQRSAGILQLFFNLSACRRSAIIVYA